MADLKKHRKPKIFAMCVSMAIIVVGYIACISYVHSFNYRERVLNGPMQNNECKVSVEPRGGSTDSWQKPIDSTMWCGTIYEAKITNIGEYIISKWKLRINVHEKCYINNAWCGELEIHQQVHGQEKVQNIDLRRYDLNKLEIDYILDGQDLMIPLEAGDYFIYKPSSEVKEYPIAAVNDKIENYRTVTSGLILYHPVEHKMTFDDNIVFYNLHKRFVQVPAFWVLVALSLIWGIVFTIFVTTEINNRMIQYRLLQDEEIIEESLNVFTRFVDAKDTYTNGHSQRVALYSKMIAEKMGLSEDECRHVFYVALMHDCGKVAIPDTILKKPDRLTDEEYEIIKTHTARGAEMLKNFHSLKGIKEGALYHHERYDGKGYPMGKKGDEIPLIGRIICVADSFDAMNSRRCYRNRLSKEKIIFELQSNKGKQFDPKVVDRFLELIQEEKINFNETT